MKIQQFKEDHSQFASLCFRVFVSSNDKHFWDYRSQKVVDSGWNGRYEPRWTLFHWEG